MENVLHDIFGNKLNKYVEKKCSLPLYLQDGKQFADVSVNGCSFVLVRVVDEIDRFQIKQIKKQYDKYSDLMNNRVVYGFNRLSQFQRRSLIENDIPFIASNGQAYIPFLFAYFDKCNKRDVEVSQKFAPSTQTLFLLFLYGKNSYTKSEAADYLNMNPMSVSRASKQLLMNGLIEEKKNGTAITMSLCEERMAYYEKGLKLLINPVQDSIYLKKQPKCAKIPAAGEYCLSLRTDYAYPDYVEYACYKDNERIADIKGDNPDLNPDSDLMRIQKWKYDPSLFVKDNMIDPVSLICSLRDVGDERIHKCLEQVKGEIINWKI